MADNMRLARVGQQGVRASLRTENRKTGKIATAGLIKKEPEPAEELLGWRMLCGGLRRVLY